MTELQSSTHRFESPPVYETALTVQFDELREFRSVHFGRFHEMIRDQFPETEDHPRVDPISERFPSVLRIPQLRIVPKKHEPERVLYRDQKDGALLLQLQPDRFSLNWRRVNHSEPYPSFSDNGNRFVTEFARFNAFCESQTLGAIKPNLCEVIYVNRIFPEVDETPMDCFGKIFTGIEWKHNGDFLPNPEIATLNRVYPIGNRQGRLYAEAGIAPHPKRGSYVLLKMTARVLQEGADDLVKSLQLAHDWVVNGFVSLTAIEAQLKRWKRQSQ